MKRTTFKKPTLEQVKAKQVLKRSQRAKNSPKSSLKRGGMTKPIPLKMRLELAEDPFMSKCCLASFDDCIGAIQWHHNLIYAGKRQNEYGAILPLCRHHHEKESQFKPLLDSFMFDRMTKEDRAKYPRKTW
jgi:hypothetical protein